MIRTRTRGIGGRLGRWTAPAALALGLLPALAGCGDPPPWEGEGIPVEAPPLRPADGLLDSPALQRVVELELRRDGEALRALLADEDPAVRARAAFSLASVQDAGAVDALQGLLDDPDAGVRRDAAFALGHYELADGGAALADALEGEEEAEVRVRLIEALGRAGDEGAVGRLLALGPGDREAAWTRALARAGVREVEAEGLVEALLERLTHPDAEVRSRAALFFSQVPELAVWADHLDAVREILDGYAPDEPAAVHLALAVARHRHRADRERVLHWLENAEDWRTRVNVARGLGNRHWLEAEGVREALFRALEDESGHVGATAALALTRGFWIPPGVLAAMEDWIRGPARHWRTQLPFLWHLADAHDPEAVAEWLRRMAREEPEAARAGLFALVNVPYPTVGRVYEELTEHRNPRVRGAALFGLSLRWEMEIRGEEDVMRFRDLFLEAAREGELPSALYGARALAHPGFVMAGSGEELREIYRSRREAGDLHYAIGLLEVLARAGDVPSVELVREALADEDVRFRRAAARALANHLDEEVDPEAADLAGPDLAVDWELLASLGPAPRLRIETEKGAIVVRLAPEQAPLTVQALAMQAGEGLHDGARFHRVQPNFMVQAGDFVMGDGSGSPGYQLRTEITQIPFGRGVAGMASAGRDTEGSQFFLTHSVQPHLEGELTAFGWVESGEAVLDHIYAGDRIVRMTVEPDGGG